jgi:hypothetical protein
MVKCICLPSIMIFSMFRAIRLRGEEKYIRFCVDFHRNIQVLPEKHSTAYNLFFSSNCTLIHLRGTK